VVVNFSLIKKGFNGKNIVLGKGCTKCLGARIQESLHSRFGKSVPDPDKNRLDPHTGYNMIEAKSKNI
jgi:hypothetical protein